MRENRTHGSEGGEGQHPSRPLSRRDRVLDTVGWGPGQSFTRLPCLDVLGQSRRDKKAAKRLWRELLEKRRRAPRVLIADKLRSYFRSARIQAFTAWAAVTDGVMAA